NKSNVIFGTSLNGYGRTYFAKRNFNKGSIIMMGLGKIIDHQTKHCSVQMSLQKHFLPYKWCGRYWNHSCNPNCSIKSRKDRFPNLISRKAIKEGDEITYAYYFTEYKWSIDADENSITCRCYTKNCRKKILSFSQLSSQKQSNIRKQKLISTYLYAIKIIERNS